MSREWTPEQKEAASKRMRERHEANKTAEVKARIRTPIGAKRDITAVHDTPDGFVDRWVNDELGRVDKFKQAGYENVESAKVGSSDDSHAENGVVSRDMGKGVTAYLMRQRVEDFNEDQAEKQKYVDSTEESMRKSKTNANESKDGTYGEVRIN